MCHSRPAVAAGNPRLVGEVTETPSNSLWEQTVPKELPERVLLASISNPDAQLGTRPGLPGGPLRRGGGGHYWRKFLSLPEAVAMTTSC